MRWRNDHNRFRPRDILPRYLALPFSEADPMPAFVTFGRVLFAVLFMYTGATKLFAVQQTADFIASKVTIPAMLAPYASQLETMAGMPMSQLLAYGAGGFEILAGLMIAVNF